MKALAFRSRGENKDAYDIAYLLRNFGGGPRDVAARVSEFLFDARHDETEADAWGAVRDLLDALPR